MTEVLEPVEQAPFVIHPVPSHQMDDDQFFEFCQINRDLRIERSSEGDLIIMAPSGNDSSIQNAALTALFFQWSRQDGTGALYDSSGGFNLPNGSIRSADVAWVLKDRLRNISKTERQGFPKLCPDFVLELRSATDAWSALKEKMQEYIDNGARLGWLIDPLKKQVIVYRPGQSPELLNNPVSLAGENVLNGFTLNLQEVWSVLDFGEEK